MPRKKHTPEQVINKLREAEVVMVAGRPRRRLQRWGVGKL